MIIATVRLSNEIENTLLELSKLNPIKKSNEMGNNYYYTS
jgi:hypothetical protein